MRALSWLLLACVCTVAPGTPKATDNDIITAVSELLSRGSRIEQSEVVSIRTTGRRRRSHHQNHVEFKMTAFGKLFRLKLRRNKKIVSKNFRVGGETADWFRKTDTRCYYTGKLEDSEDSVVALSLCDGLRGIIKNGTDTFAVSVLPEGSANVSDAHVVLQLRSDDLRAYYSDYSDKVLIRALNSSARVRKIRSHSQRAPAALTNLSKAGRVRTSPAVVESAFFVDESLYKHLKKIFPSDTHRQVQIFSLTLVNQLQTVYEQESLGGIVKIVLTYLEILYPQPKDKIPPNEDFDYYLTSFCIYQQARRNIRETNYAQWDYAVLISAMSMFARNKRGEVMRDVVGMTAVQGMCNELHSCALLEGRDLQSAHIIAHEMGHSLGMEHDGDGDNRLCPWNAHIMSSTTGLSKKTWSSCSLRSLNAYLNTERADCLYRRSSHHEYKADVQLSVHKKLPGIHYTADQQCEMKFGDGYRRSRVQSQEDICRILKCEFRTMRSTYIRYGSYTALEGTQCGDEMWCRNRVCSRKTSSDSNILVDSTMKPVVEEVTESEQISAAWAPWSIWSKCESECTAREGHVPRGIRYATRNCIDSKPGTKLALEKCNGSNIRAQLCEPDCKESAKNLDRLIQETCTAVMERNNTYTGSGTQFFQNKERYSCRIWCKREQGLADVQMGLLPEGAECYGPGEAQNKFCVKGSCMRFNCSGDSIHVQRDPTPEEAYCVAPVLRPQIEEPPKAAISATRHCSHSCIKGGRGTLFQLGCTDCEMDSLVLCDDSSKCNKPMLSANEYATISCGEALRKHQHVFVSVGIQPPYSDDHPEDQCLVSCRDVGNPHIFFIVNTQSGSFFPAGTPCVAEGRVVGFCQHGKCVAESEFQVTLHRTTQEREKDLRARVRRSIGKNIRFIRLSEHPLYSNSTAKLLYN